MPILKNPRHERFAQLLVAGNSADKAYKEAGYKPDRSAASRQSSKVHIKARVNELMGKTAKRLEITLESLTDMFLHDRRRADELEQISASVSAGEKIGKLYGMFVERKEITGTIEYSEVGDTDRAKAIALLVAKSKQAPAVH